MRLGDLDALKEVLINEYEAREHYMGNIMLEAIDNAPTIEPTYISDMPDDIVKDLQELAIDYDEGIAVFERKRSKGEWIDHAEDYGYAECPFCHELTNCDGNIDELHFCWNCGAEMKGGTEE